MKFRRIMFVLCSLCYSNVNIMADTVVTTYVTKVQEERQSTRWTLTEWLRIKERMKMMDVWLAMFSDPKKDKFRLELNLQGGKSKARMNYDDGVAAKESADVDGDFARAQLWLTNIITGTTGLRLLNIDFGVEGDLRRSGEFEPDTTTIYAKKRNFVRTQYSGNMRIFGKSVQDSSIVLKVGQYDLRNSVPMLDTANTTKLWRGLMLGGDLQLYVFHWLGIDGSYVDYKKSKRDADGWQTWGDYYDYGAFIEISLIRLSFAQYQEFWVSEDEGLKRTQKERGYQAGLGLSF